MTPLRDCLSSHQRHSPHAKTQGKHPYLCGYLWLFLFRGRGCDTWVTEGSSKRNSNLNFCPPDTRAQRAPSRKRLLQATMATVRRCFRATLLASLSFAVCCGVVSGFLPSRSSYGRNDRSAVRRRNMINPTSTRPRSSTSFCSIRRDGGDTHQGTTIDGARLSSPAMFSSREGFASRPASSSKMSLRMVSDYGDGQQEKHNWKRTDNAHDDNSSVTDTINSSMTADSSHDVRDGDGKNPLLQTLGGGKYVVQSVLGTGSTASTYRCKAAQQQETSDDR